MARVKSPSPSNSNTKPIRPSLTPEAEENQMISLAVNLVKQRLIDTKTLYKDAIAAIRRYSGYDSESEEDEINGY